MSATTHHPAPAPVGGKLVTPVTFFLAVMVVSALAVLGVRFVQGLGATTNLNNGYPWGLWIAWDVVTGSALAGGGFGTALLVYMLCALAIDARGSVLPCAAVRLPHPRHVDVVVQRRQRLEAFRQFRYPLLSCGDVLQALRPGHLSLQRLSCLTGLSLGWLASGSLRRVLGTVACSDSLHPRTASFPSPHGSTQVEVAGSLRFPGSLPCSMPQSHAPGGRDERWSAGRSSTYCLPRPSERVGSSDFPFRGVLPAA